AVDGRISRRGTADGGEYSVDDRRGKCGFGAAKRCYGRRATYARKGAGHRESQDRFGTESGDQRSEEHTSELQSHSDLHSFPTRRSSDLFGAAKRCYGRRATYARKGAGHRESQDRFGTESGDQDNAKRSGGDCS